MTYSRPHETLKKFGVKYTFTPFTNFLHFIMNIISIIRVRGLSSQKKVSKCTVGITDKVLQRISCLFLCCAYKWERDGGG